MFYDQIHQYDILERCRMKESQNNDCSEQNKDESCSHCSDCYPMDYPQDVDSSVYEKINQQQ